MQKTAMFGGVSRVRISSQSLKRSMRMSDYYETKLGMPSLRTRDLGKLKERCSEALKDRFDKDTIGKALEMMSGKEGIAEGVEAMRSRLGLSMKWLISAVFCYPASRM